jgi:hypothetical protein
MIYESYVGLLYDMADMQVLFIWKIIVFLVQFNIDRWVFLRKSLGRLLFWYQ